MSNKLKNSECIVGKSVIVSVCVLLLFVVSFVSCSEHEDIKFVPAPLTITNVDEQFDTESTLYVRASFTTSRPDTIASIGFVYTDAVENEAKPVIGVDHVLSISKFQDDESMGMGVRYFEGLINPIRTSPVNYWYAPNIAAYIVNTSGKTFLSKVARLTGDKVKLQDVYPRYATAGSVVKATLNRQFYSKKFYASHLGGEYGQPYNVSLLINDQTILVDSIGRASELFFKMPIGLKEDTPIKLKIGEYEVEYEKPLKNATLNFESLTEFERSYQAGYFLFSTPGSFYLGGGNDVTNTKVLTDFWKYDVATKVWSRIADYPSTGRERGMTFTIGDNAYCGNPDNFQRYNFSSNTWSTVSLPTNDLQYNHTFSSATSGVYDGKAYFSNFNTPHISNGITYGNYWRFDPLTETYTAFPNLMGVTLGSIDYTGYMAQAVAYNNELHFFRNLQHWRYIPKGTYWLSCKDVDQEGRDIKAFLLKGEMYGIVTTLIPGGYYGSMGKTYTLYKYNRATDSWIRDADVPRTYNGEDISPMTVSFDIIQTSDSEVSLCLEDGLKFSFYKIKS